MVCLNEWCGWEKRKTSQNRKFDDTAEIICLSALLVANSFVSKIRDKTMLVLYSHRFQSMRDTFRTYLNLFDDVDVDNDDHDDVDDDGCGCGKLVFCISKCLLPYISALFQI